MATAPLLYRGPSCGHDFDFHLVSWLDAQNAWRHGQFYPHWAPSANFGAGEPRFVFYPPLTWMLGAALGLALPWTLVPFALTFLLLAGTGLATRALARQALSDGAATLAGCAALFSGYSLFTAYERTAYGELTGGFWIPLLLLFALRQRNPAGSTWRRALDGSAGPLALVVAGAWLSNAPLGVMASYLLAFVALAAALLGRCWAPLLRAAVGAGLGLAVAAFYLIPAAVEQHWIDIRQATEDVGERIESSWLFAHHSDPAMQSHDEVLHRVSVLAAIMLTVAVVGMLVAWLRGIVPGLKPLSFLPANAARLKSCPDASRLPELESDAVVSGLHKEELRSETLRLSEQGSGNDNSSLAKSSISAWWLPLALIPLAILFLLLPPSLPVWNLLPKLRFLQFPWRWLVALEAPMGIFLAAAIWPRKRWPQMAIAILSTAAFVASTAYAAHAFFQACDDEDAVPGMLSVYATGTGFEGTDEYAPPGTDDSLQATGLPAACFTPDPTTPLGAPIGQSAEGTFPAWDASQGSCQATFAWTEARPDHWRIRAPMPRAGSLVLHLRRFPALDIRLNGQRVDQVTQREDGLMAFAVPQGPLDLTVDWTTTPDTLAGRWLSALALLLLTALCALERRLRQPRLS
jgi:hypothetical protein